MLSLSSPLIRRIDVRPEVAADDVAAQRQRQAGPLQPPHAEVDDQVQPLVLERQLPLVDDQAGLELARGHGGDDLVERHHFVRRRCPCPGRNSSRRAR